MSVFKKTSSKKTIQTTTVERYSFNDIICTTCTTVGSGKTGSAVQFFKTKSPLKSHQFAYEPKRLCFDYYADTSFLNNENLAFAGRGNVIPQPVVINPLDLRKSDLANVLAIHLSVDGNVYKIDSPYPLSTWRHSSYLGGFSNDEFDLEKLQKHLKKQNWVWDLKITEIPFYITSGKKTHALDFMFLPPSNLIKKICDKFKTFNQNQFGAFGVTQGIDPFGAKKFLLSEK